MDFKFEGNFELLKSKEEVYALLSDPKRIAPLLPNLDHVELHEGGEFTVKVRVGLKIMKSTATIRIRLSEGQPFSYAVYKGTGLVGGEPLMMQAAFDLQGNGTQTQVNWRGEATVGGNMPTAVGKLMEPLAKQSIKGLVDSIKTALT